MTGNGSKRRREYSDDARCSPGCGPASGSPAGRPRAPGRAAGQRRHAARRGPPPDARRSPTSPARSPASVGPIPAAEAASYAAQGYPPDAKVGLDGLERDLPDAARRARREARCCRAAAMLARTTPPSPATTSTPRSTRRSSGRRSPRWPGATPGWRRWTRAPARCWRVAGVGVLGAAAARLDDEDHHRDRRARGGHRQARRHVPHRQRGDDRRLHAAQRRRRGLRRHVPQRVRGLLQLGVRAARRQARRASDGRRRRAVRVRPAPVDPGRRREPDPVGARRSAATWRSGPRRSGRARCRPARSR